MRKDARSSATPPKYILMGTSSNFGNMFSARGRLTLPSFPPDAPMRYCSMNLFYDVANMTLPTDNVDEEYTILPRRWDIGFVRKFTLFFGPFSSLYDFLDLRHHAFHIPSFPGYSSKVGGLGGIFWTEVLVIFVIRTRRIPFVKSRSKKRKWLTVLTLSCVALGTISRSLCSEVC